MFLTWHHQSDIPFGLALELGGAPEWSYIAKLCLMIALPKAAELVPLTRTRATGSGSGPACTTSKSREIIGTDISKRVERCKEERAGVHGNVFFFGRGGVRWCLVG